VIPSTVVKDKLETHLEHFTRENQISGKGPLSLVLILTRDVSRREFPLKAKDFVTGKKGQVKGLSGSKIQTILRDHGITQRLAEEGGRTSRGSIEKMELYVDFLNKLFEKDLLDFERIEMWWIARVKEHFARLPFRVRLDSSKSLRFIFGELLAATVARQRACPGMMITGAVMQHLVGAKLQLLFPDLKIEHHGFSVADSSTMRVGDFKVEDAIIHVTSAPGEPLLRKCADNLSANLRPLIITTETGVGGARALASNLGIEDRLDVLEITQFLTANVYEWSRFSQKEHPASVISLINTYNRIIDECESNPSLRIQVT